MSDFSECWRKYLGRERFAKEKRRRLCEKIRMLCLSWERLRLVDEYDYVSPVPRYRRHAVAKEFHDASKNRFLLVEMTIVAVSAMVLT